MNNMLALSFYYEEPAKTLAEHTPRHGYQDLHFLPICYLFRNSMELALKYLIKETNSVRRSESTSPLGHSLERLTGLSSPAWTDPN